MDPNQNSESDQEQIRISLTALKVAKQHMAQAMAALLTQTPVPPIASTLTLLSGAHAICAQMISRAKRENVPEIIKPRPTI